MKRSMIAMAVLAGLQQQAEVAKATGGTAKSKSFCDKDWDDAFDGNGEVIYFRFRNGETLELDMTKVPEETRRLLSFHGAVQKVGDSYAGVKGDFPTGIANARAGIEMLFCGEWEQEREGGGPRLAELAEAISRIRGVDLEKVKQVVEAATPEERSSWRSNATVKAEVAKMRHEKAQAALEAAGTREELKINLGQ